MTFLINGFFIFYKGTPALKLDKTELWVGIVCALSMGIVASVISWYYYVPRLRDRMNGIRRRSSRVFPQLEDRTFELELTELDTETNTDDNPLENTNVNIDRNITLEEELSNETIYNRDLTITNNIDRLKSIVKKLKIKKQDNKILQLHSNAEVFDEESEKVCTSLQIITACFSSFAHGANDVANSIAPLATIYAIYSSGEFETESNVPVWVLFIGGSGIVLGLATWGYKIIDRIGRELTKVTPSRGFIIELAAATTVVFASRTAIPVSTTHCQVGSVVGCGIADGTKNVDWKIMRSILFSWLITLPVTGFISAGLFSFCHYSP
jgi:sodium-dependent phosphate transporter